MDMGRVHPWIGLDWVELGWVGLGYKFQPSGGLGWVQIGCKMTV